MSDNRYHGATFIGAPLTRQQKLNTSNRQLCDAHPLSCGWQKLRVNTSHWLVVYHRSGVELMRCPKGDGWLIKYLGERRRVRLHISELTANLDGFKRAIEAQLSNQFTARAA